MMAARKTEASTSQVAWRRFSKLARQFREADGDAELRALLLVRVRKAFDEWAAAAEAAK